MAIKALFENGKNETTVEGLYQWDYGQILEIEASDLGTEIVEVHFACTNMTEAIVRSCTLTNGIGTVVIPDDCLEQSTTITAWVYTIDGTQGKTRKVIHIPIIARTRPSARRDIPQNISDRYAELIAEVNEAINGLESGKIVAGKAQNASNANYAASAGNASSASYAATAGNVNKAEKLGSPPIYSEPFGVAYFPITEPGVYLVGFGDGARRSEGLICVSPPALVEGCVGVCCDIVIEDDGSFDIIRPVYNPSDGGLRIQRRGGTGSVPIYYVTRIITYPNE